MCCSILASTAATSSSSGPAIVTASAFSPHSVSPGILPLPLATPVVLVSPGVIEQLVVTLSVVIAAATMVVIPSMWVLGLKISSLWIVPYTDLLLW